jgi:hypothetical protein
MTSIPGIAQLTAYVRRQAETVKRATAAGPGADTAALAPGRAVPSEAAPVSESAALDSLVAARVASIDACEPGAAGRAFRVHLEVVLRSELAAQIGDRDAFYRLVDRVWHDLKEDEGVSQAMEIAGASLLARCAGDRNAPGSADA